MMMAGRYLYTRCAVLGAANPKYGRFDAMEPIPSQIKLEPALLSRFDLILPMRDVPDKGRDRALMGHIMASHSDGGGHTAPLGPDILRKYIAHAKREVHPRMAAGEMERVVEWYVRVRAEGGADEAIPATPRQGEAMIRLCMASARLRLSPSGYGRMSIGGGVTGPGSRTTA